MGGGKFIYIIFNIAKIWASSVQSNLHIDWIYAFCQIAYVKYLSFKYFLNFSFYDICKIIHPITSYL